MRRVDRQEGCAGLRDRPYADEVVEGPRHAQRHHGAGTDPLVDQCAGQFVGYPVELAVGDVGALEPERGPPRIPVGRGRQQVRQGTRLDRRQAPDRCQHGMFGGFEQFDVPDGGIGGRRHRLQYPQQPVGEPAHRPGVEDVGREHDSGRHARGGAVGVELLRHAHLEVEIGDVVVGFDGAHPNTGKLHVRARDRAELEQHLEQRRMRGGPGRIHRVDHPLERRVGVHERTQVGLPDPMQQLRERTAAADGAPQDERVDEHPHHVVERGRAPARDRGADGDVLGAAETGQQDGERGVHHHEYARVVCAREIDDACVQLRGEFELDAAALL